MFQTQLPISAAAPSHAFHKIDIDSPIDFSPENKSPNHLNAASPIANTPSMRPLMLSLKLKFWITANASPVSPCPGFIFPFSSDSIPRRFFRIHTIPDFNRSSGAPRKSAKNVPNPSLNLSNLEPSSFWYAVTDSNNDIITPTGQSILANIVPNALAPEINGSKNLNNPEPAPLIKSAIPVDTFITGFSSLVIRSVALVINSPVVLTFILFLGSCIGLPSAPIPNALRKPVLREPKRSSITVLNGL